MDSAGLQELFVQLRSFSDGQIDRDTLRKWFLPYHTAPVSLHDAEDDVDSADSWSADKSSRALFWNVVWLIEGDATEDRHRDLAGRLAACFSGLDDAAAVLDLLPLIVARERFCSIVMKHRTGIVSRVGLLSVIAKTFPWQHDIRDWLTTASVDNMEALCRFLAADDYSSVVTHLSLPSA